MADKLRVFSFVILTNPLGHLCILAIGMDSYVHILKPLRCVYIATHPRVFLAVSRILMTSCFLYIVRYICLKVFLCTL